MDKKCYYRRINNQKFIKENQCLLILKESQGDKRHKKC